MGAATNTSSWAPPGRLQSLGRRRGVTSLVYADDPQPRVGVWKKEGGPGSAPSHTSVTLSSTRPHYIHTFWTLEFWSLGFLASHSPPCISTLSLLCWPFPLWSLHPRGGGFLPRPPSPGRATESPSLLNSGQAPVAPLSQFSAWSKIQAGQPGTGPFVQSFAPIRTLTPAAASACKAGAALGAG